MHQKYISTIQNKINEQKSNQIRVFMLFCVLLAVRFCFSSVKPEVGTGNVNKDGDRLEPIYFGCKCAF